MTCNVILRNHIPSQALIISANVNVYLKIYFSYILALMASEKPNTHTSQFIMIISIYLEGV